MMKYAFVVSAGLMAANVQPAQALHYNGPVIDTAATAPMCQEYEVYSYNPYGTDRPDRVSLMDCENKYVFTTHCMDVHTYLQQIKNLDNPFAKATKQEISLALRERCAAPFAFPLHEFRLGGHGASR